jgi:hypothetical protein
VSADHPERDPLLDQLAAVWETRDPVPSGLVERSLRTVHEALEADDLDLELELLVLLDRSEELVGTRAAAGPVTLQFAGDELQLLLRVTPVGAGRCRVDAWLTPEAGWSVTAVQGRRHTPAVVAAPGRFEFPDLARGTTRLVVAATEPSAARLLGTSPFDL